MGMWNVCGKSMGMTACSALPVLPYWVSPSFLSRPLTHRPPCSVTPDSRGVWGLQYPSPVATHTGLVD